MRNLIVVALCVALSGCSIFQNLTGNPSTDLPAIGNSITSADAAAQKSALVLAKFTAADLQAADADAMVNADAPAHACYQAILPVVQARESAAATIGAISAFQRTRDMVKL